MADVADVADVADAEPEAAPTSGPTYHRRIRVWPGPGEVSAEMVDYVHHFRVELEHRDGVVTAARARGIRVPWHTCPLGVAGIGRLVGTPLAAVGDAPTWAADRSAQCVHTLDLTLVALAHVHDRAPLEYVATVIPPMGPRRVAVLRRGGHEVLSWTVAGTTIVAPDPFAGRSLGRRDFARWTAELFGAGGRDDPGGAGGRDGPGGRDDPAGPGSLAPDRAGREAATVLRRACHIAGSRLVDLDRYRFAGDVVPPDSSCYTYRPEVAGRAARVRGGGGAPFDGP